MSGVGPRAVTAVECVEDLGPLDLGRSTTGALQPLVDRRPGSQTGSVTTQKLGYRDPAVSRSVCRGGVDLVIELPDLDRLCRMHLMMR